MTEIRNVAADASRLRLRVLAVGLVVFLAFCLIVARLVFCRWCATKTWRRRLRATARPWCPSCPTAG